MTFITWLIGFISGLVISIAGLYLSYLKLTPEDRTQAKFTLKLILRKVGLAGKKPEKPKTNIQIASEIAKQIIEHGIPMPEGFEPRKN